MPIFSRFARYVEEVARRGSIRSASERINIAPSAIDRQIILAEEELGIRLFDRLPQGMKLTEAGQHLVQQLRRWNREFEVVRSEIDRIQGLESGRVTLAMGQAMVGDIMAGTLAKFHAEHPRVFISVHVQGSSGIREMVMSGTADIGLTFMPTDYRVMRVEHSVSLCPGLSMLPDHALAARQTLQIEECVDLPIILPTEDLLIRNSFDIALAKAGATIRPVMSCSDFSLLKKMIFAGIGLGLTTKAEVLSEVVSGRLAFVSLSDPEITPSALSLITGPEPSTAAAKLARMIAETMDGMTAG